MSTKATKPYLSVSLSDLDSFLNAKNEAEVYLKEVLKNLPISELFENFEKSLAFARSFERPAYYIEPRPLVNYTIADTSKITISLCLDIKQYEIYEYDNYRHRQSFSKKANQQFKILRAVCEANGNYISTAELKKIAGCKSIDATYKVIEKVNYKANLICTLGKLIIGAQGKGYRLNPDYRISIV